MLRAYFANLLRLSSLIFLPALIPLSVCVWLFGEKLTISGIARPRRPLARGLFIFCLLPVLRHYLSKASSRGAINSSIRCWRMTNLVSMGSSLSAEEVEVIRERFRGAQYTA